MNKYRVTVRLTHRANMAGEWKPYSPELPEKIWTGRAKNAEQAKKIALAIHTRTKAFRGLVTSVTQVVE